MGWGYAPSRCDAVRLWLGSPYVADIGGSLLARVSGMGDFSFLWNIQPSVSNGLHFTLVLRSLNECHKGNVT